MRFHDFQQFLDAYLIQREALEKTILTKLRSRIPELPKHMNHTDLRVLEVYSQRPDFRTWQVAKIIELGESMADRSIHNLLRMQLATARKDPNNRAARWVHLTQAGIHVVDEARRARRQMGRDIRALLVREGYGQFFEDLDELPFERTPPNDLPEAERRLPLPTRIALLDVPGHRRYDSGVKQKNRSPNGAAARCWPARPSDREGKPMPAPDPKKPIRGKEWDDERDANP